MARKILVVDDSEINRQLLKETLAGDYDVVEAANGEEALALMHRLYKILSAVLLDIVMPVMDGYEFLRRVRDNILLSQIPVVMVTGSEDESSRVKALSLGANDFIIKPYNPEIVRHCLKNNIALRETASILNAIQRDKLTGLYNRETFFEKVAAMTREREPGYYVLSSFDIDNFKLINDQYGAAEGDRILREIGKAVGKNADEIGGVAARVSADNFAALIPADRSDTEVLARIQRKDLVSLDKQAVLFSVGRLVVSDPSLPPSAMYDRAYIAKQSVKGRYDKHLAYFDDAMLEKLVREQQITGEMETALSLRQFEAWFQPQYNHASGALIGAEALARWRHPQRGIIPPASFIPLFEQNGFIYEMDKYIWGEACRCIRKWLDEGRAVLPVSVNISRYDIFRNDLIDVLTGLIRSFGIPADLLRLEITESAFATSAKRIVEIVKRLIALGFTVEIDDFGSGYSSLNTLKNVPAQVVKLDMRFLEGSEDAQRGGSILESIVRMTKWLGMTVLAEGVEDRGQADFLKSIGCTYVQGYLYARPMPASEYETLLVGSGARAYPAAPALPGENAFWNPASLDSLVFNNFAGSACVYEYCDGRVEMVRITDQYVKTVFGGDMTAEGALAVDWTRHTDEATALALRDAMLESIEHGGEVTGEYRFTDLPGCPGDTYLRSSLRVIGSTDERHLVYCASVNVTREREAERKNAVYAQQLRAVMDNVGCGITAVTFEGDRVQYLLVNDRYFEILGYTREAYGKIQDFSPIVPADRQRAIDAARRVYRTGQSETIECRAVRADGRAIWLRDEMTMTRFENVEKPVQLSIFSDITEQKKSLEKLRVSEEVYRLAMRHSKNVVGRYDVEAAALTLPKDIDPLYELGETLADVPEGQIRDGRVSPETADAYRAFYLGGAHGEKSGSATFQWRTEGGWCWIEGRYTMIFSDAGAPATAVVTLMDVTDNVAKEAAYQKWRQSLHARKDDSYALFRVNVTRRAVLDAMEGMLMPGEKIAPSFRLDERTRHYAAQCVSDEDRRRFAAFVDSDALLARHARGERSAQIEYRESLPGDAARWLRLTVDLIDTPYSPDVEAYFLFENIDEEKRRESDMRSRAETDPLTGLYNRAAFARKVDERLRASAPEETHALFMLDIDGFKLVNDMFGHAEGDRTLTEIARKLTAGAPRGEIAGRLGGDEFVVFAPNVGDRAEAARTAQRLRALAQKAFNLEVQISGSVGGALWPRDGADFERLYRSADETLYRVKGAGKDGYAFAGDALPDTPARGLRRRMLIVEDDRLDAAFLEGLFRDDFQIEKARDGNAALIRLRHYGSSISVVLLDLVMPGADGFEVLGKMRQSAETTAIPVVVVSGAEDHDVCLRAIRAGAADFVTKPVDPDILRLRVLTAIGKAENERTRARNSFIELQNSEINSVKAALEHTGAILIEHDWLKGTFTYNPFVSEHLAGRYDARPLWRILLSDMVADSKTVKAMQRLVHDVANDRARADGRMKARLKTPSGQTHRFEMNVYKQANEFGLTDKCILTFRDEGADDANRAGV